jgi:3',5'-cyclic AMP phosphodiesterase CpdA
MVRVIQISDTHLSPIKRHFAENWAPVAAWIAEQKPTLVIHTGDVTVDAADHENDAVHCASLLKSLGVPVVVVPGNHDVGEPGNAHQPVNEERLERFRRHFGADRWIHDVEGWRLIGLNSMIFGSGGREEAEQSRWLEAVMTDNGGRRLAWFMHRPLFIDNPHEGDTGYWSVKPEPRRKLYDLMDRYPVDIVATGHLHRWHEVPLNGTHYIWSPATGFLVGEKMCPPMGGSARLGATIYDIEGEGISVKIVPVDGLTTYWIDDLVHEVYPLSESVA